MDRLAREALGVNSNKGSLGGLRKVGYGGGGESTRTEPADIGTPKDAISFGFAWTGGIKREGANIVAVDDGQVLFRVACVAVKVKEHFAVDCGGYARAYLRLD